MCLVLVCDAEPSCGIYNRLAVPPTQARIAPCAGITKNYNDIKFRFLIYKRIKKLTSYSRALDRPHQISVKKYGVVAVEKTLKKTTASSNPEKQCTEFRICTNNGCGLDCA